MAEGSESERLRQLEQKIARAKGKDAPPPEDNKYTQANVAWRMVTELVAGLFLGLGIGMGLDWLFGTKPFLMIVFIILGFIAGVKTMMRTATEVQVKQAAKAAEEKQAAEVAED
ncbi:AtpZ/AtpI family protein [Tropicimonas sp. IMCC34043]|uniref:AtpZ/AtpI family protein n=1 Tax=Tropicimonas sp. IMCC34043 TaxID=2248760 RepID=UPI001E3480F7|nr:AtpZ/AtpI family protein [Tropicimonas sp. IMCC34043]